MNNDITIDKIRPRARYIADGTNVEFPFLFSIFTAEDLDVYLNDILQKSSIYTTVINNDGNGKIIFNTVPDKGEIITIIRNLEIKRTSDFQESGAFRARAINHELDYQVACTQQLEERLDRSIIMPPYSALDSVLTIPKPQKGRALVWNEDGTNFKNSDLEIDSAFISIANVVPAAEQVAADAAEVRKKTEKLFNLTETLENLVLSKATTDADNFTAEGKKTLTGLLMPDYTAPITIYTMSGTRPVNENGTFANRGYALCHMRASTNGNCAASINGAVISSPGSSNSALDADSLLVMVDQGDKWIVSKSSDGPYDYIKLIFFPMKGIN